MDIYDMRTISAFLDVGGFNVEIEIVVNILRSLLLLMSTHGIACWEHNDQS